MKAEKSKDDKIINPVFKFPVDIEYHSTLNKHMPKILWIHFYQTSEEEDKEGSIDVEFEVDESAKKKGRVTYIGILKCTENLESEVKNKYLKLGTQLVDSLDFERNVFKVRIWRNLREILNENIWFKFNGKSYKLKDVPLDTEDTTEGIEFKGYYNLQEFEKIVKASVDTFASQTIIKIYLQDLDIVSM